MIALDTNVLIYACDRSDLGRQRQALDLIERAVDGVLLWQVACEFIAASRKLSIQGLTATDAWNRLAEFQALFPLVQPSGAALLHARELHLSRGVSFWDAMILAACVDAKVEILYTEDLPAAPISSPTVINPFR
jgi:predicted nucleic acid-binding protein